MFLHRPIVEKLLHLITDRDKIKKVFFGPSMTSSMFAVVWFYAWKKEEIRGHVYLLVIYFIDWSLFILIV